MGNDLESSLDRLISHALFQLSKFKLKSFIRIFGVFKLRNSSFHIQTFNARSDDDDDDDNDNDGNGTKK